MGRKGAVMILALVVAGAACTWSIPARSTATPRPMGTTLPAQGSPSPVAGTSSSPSSSPSPSQKPTGSSTATPTPAAALVIQSLPFHAGDIGYAYRPVTAVGAGGVQPYKWSISSGGLPPGLTMSSAGVTTGTPTTLGSYSFTVRVDDAAGNAQGFGSSVAINPPVSATARCSNVDIPCYVESGCQNVCGGIGTQSGGSAPYQYSANGALPSGTSLSGFALAGTFTSPANTSYTFTVTVTDDAGASATVQDSFYVYAHISIDGPYSFSFKVGNVPASVQVKYTAPNFFASTITTAGNPPSAPYLDKNQPYIDIAIPATRQGATWKFDVTIGDTYDCAANLKCSTTATVVITVA